MAALATQLCLLSNIGITQIPQRMSVLDAIIYTADNKRYEVCVSGGEIIWPEPNFCNKEFSK